MKKLFTFLFTIAILSFNEVTQIPSSGLLAYYHFNGNDNDVNEILSNY